MSLQGESFWEDEAQSFYQARNPFFLSGDNPFGIQDLQDRFVFLRYILDNDIHPPLYYAQLGLWSLLGISDWFMRSNSIFWGILTIAAVYYLAKQLPISPLVPLIAASLVALSPFHVEMSIELRMYSLIAFLAVASIIYLHRILNLATPSRWTWIAFTLINAGIYYAQGVGILWLLIPNLIYLGVAIEHWLRNRQLPSTWRLWLVSQGISLMVFIPWFAIKFRGGLGSAAGVAKYLKVPTLVELFATPGRLLFNNAASPSFPSPPLDTPGWILGLLALLTAGLIAAAIVSLRKDYKMLLLLSVPSIGGLFIFYGISAIAKPIFIIRALIFCLPFFAILVAIGLVYVGQLLEQAALKHSLSQVKVLLGYRLVGLVLLTIVAINFASIYQGVVTINRKQWQATGVLVAQQIQPQDVIALPRATMGSFMLYSPPIKREDYNGLLIQKLRSYWVKGAPKKNDTNYHQFLQANRLDYGKNVSWIIVTGATEPDRLIEDKWLDSRIWVMNSPDSDGGLKGGQPMEELMTRLEQIKKHQEQHDFYQVAISAYK